VPAAEGLRAYPINTGAFSLLAWQFLFVAGVAVGHAGMSGRPQVARPSRLVLACAAAVALYGAGVQQAHWPSLWPDAVFGILLNKPALGLLRLADFGCVAYLVAVVGTRFPSLLASRPLELLGRNSLAVVATQSVAIMALLQFPALFATGAGRTLVALGTVALIFAVAAARQGKVPALLPPPPSPVNPLSPERARRLSPTG
jgi:hypothetical protein